MGRKPNPRSRFFNLFQSLPARCVSCFVLCLLIDPSHSLNEWDFFLLSSLYHSEIGFVLGFVFREMLELVTAETMMIKQQSATKKNIRRVNEICCVSELCKYNRTWTTTLTACTLFSRRILPEVQKNKKMTLWLSMWCISQESSSRKKCHTTWVEKWKSQVLCRFEETKKFNRKNS